MIYIVRHGQTAKNKAKVLQGRSDLPLNDAGRLQAKELRAKLDAKGIRFDKVYTSPLVRAIETARILADDAPQVIDDRLIELDYGPYEGMDLEHPAPEISFFFKDFIHNPAPKGVEPLSHVLERMTSFMEDIRQEASDKTILISTHAIAMKGALEALDPTARGMYWAYYVKNCALFYSEPDTTGGWTKPVPLEEGDILGRI